MRKKNCITRAKNEGKKKRVNSDRTELGGGEGEGLKSCLLSFFFAIFVRICLTSSPRPYIVRCRGAAFVNIMS